MSKQIKKFVAVCAVVGLILTICGSAQANWSETFGGNAFELPTWEFHCYPDLAGTFTQAILDGPDDNDYLTLDETSAVAIGGSAFSGGFGTDEVFTDVRLGAVVNVTGDASRNYCGLTGRTIYFIDDGSVSGYPGLVATQCYVMHVNWEDGGPANLRIDIEKIINMQNIMRNSGELGLDVRVPGLNHARSYYAELDIVGSGPVYVTGFLYEYKGGPLVAKTSTMMDTNGNDPWEDEGEHDEVFAAGVSGIFAQSEQLDENDPIGYHCTYDDVFSVSDGPAAVYPTPADGATDVSINAKLSWVEAAFSTSRELWFGKKGAMQKITPPGKTYDPGPLEFGQTYEWRVDEIGASSTVTGHTWTFTTGSCESIDDFESYADDAAIRAVWPHNIPGGYWYIFVETGTVRQGAKSMRFEYQNQYEPFLTETTKTFATAQDWTVNGVKALSLSFRGDDVNVEQPMYIKLEDSTGKTAEIEHPYTHAVQSEQWHEWDIALEDFDGGGINLAAIKKITIGTGNGTTSSGQEVEDLDVVYIDDIRLCPARCFNLDGVDLSGDANGDCVVDFKDLAIMSAGWLNDGLAVVP
jgi:hypothetical protein